jgi:hypothetical protein
MEPSPSGWVCNPESVPRKRISNLGNVSQPALRHPPSGQAMA